MREGELREENMARICATIETTFGYKINSHLMGDRWMKLFLSPIQLADIPAATLVANVQAPHTANIPVPIYIGNDYWQTFIQHCARQTFQIFFLRKQLYQHCIQNA